MRKNLTSVLLGFGFLLLSQTDTQAQITQIQDYQNLSSATIGTFQGINFREGGFSGLYPIPNTNGTEFWTCSDRGVNIDCANANTASCRPTYDKMYAFPSYAPKIHRIRISGNTVQILQTITIKRPNGTGASGIINPTDLGSTATEVASTDTVTNCADFSLKTTPKDTFGIDPEGIVVDKDGNFWLCEEGGATIWKVSPNGVLMKRYTPYANLAGVQAVDAQIDTVFKYRKNNRGFEGIAIAPNGKIYALIQSPLLYPTKTVGEGTRVHRIIEIDPATNTQRMFAYLNDGIIGASGSNQIRLRDWKIGDMAAVNDSTFLVLEAAARGTSDIKRLYQININQATVVHSGLYGSLTLEALVDSTGLANNNIKPVRKTLVMDLLANNWPAALDKAEGLAIINDSTIAICNDNDFGQFSANEDGIATATNKNCHVITYRLSGASKLSNFKTPTATALTQGRTGLQSSASPYLTPATAGVEFTALLTAGDTINGYRMAGTPDGTGAFDNGDGTFTLLVTHEHSNSVGVNRAHGAKGAFVSKWVINKNNLSVISGADLITKVNLWNGNGYTLYNPADTTSKKAFNRFCSADLPAVSAFFNSNTGLGTQERIFMGGEEAGNEGRAFGHIATGANTGTTYELPALGKFSWENSVASPAAGDKTVVVGLDDATPGQVYVYVGTKTNTGSEIEKAGLTNGRLYGVAVSGLTTETSNSVPAANTNFTLADLGIVKDSTGAAINTQSNNLGVTNFLRPEDGAWDPSNPNDFYFVTTNAFSSPSRMWRLRFNDVKNPTAGGTITAVLDGTEGQKMMDNITIDNFGNILIVEDVGNNAHLGKTWQYNTATDQLTLLASHDSTRFLSGAPSYLTQDEEASGILDMQGILPAGNFIVVDQAHYGISGEIVEGGQLLKMFNPATANANPEISVAGNNINIVNNDTVAASNDNTDFGSLFTGVPVTKTFTISNAGPGPLRINNISFSGAQAADFSITTALTYPLTVAANSSLTITAKVIAQASGTRNAYLVISNNDFDENTFRFAVKGNVIPAEIAVTGNNSNITNGDLTPDASDYTNYGSVKVNILQSRNFTISNSGADTLRVSNVTFSGPQAASFSLASTPILPFKVAPGSNVTIKVNAMLTATGVHDATITINNNDNDEGTFNFALRANGITPEINLAGINNGDSTVSAANQTDFQGVGKGYYKEQTFTVQNSGTDTLKISGIQISGLQASAFRLTNAPVFPVLVLPGNNTNFGIRFTPAVAGANKARVTVLSNDLDEASYRFAVEGNGLIREISIEGNNTVITSGDNTPALTDSTDFGQVIRGENTTRTYTIKNSGTDSLVISNINVSGNQWNDFTLVNAPAMPLVVAAGSSRNITVKFTPSAVGTRNAVINLTNNDEDEANFTFAIKGEGTPASGLLNATQNGPDALLYPNPTSANTTLLVTTTEGGNAVISIVDLHGREALYSANTNINTGTTSIELPTSNLTNGIYFVCISMEGKSTIIKLAVMR